MAPLATFAAGPGAVTPVSLAPATVTSVALQKHTAGTYYIDAAIEGFGPVRMLVDTGSSHVVIGEDILDALKRTQSIQYVRETRGVMADGTPRGVPIYRLDGLRIGETCWVRNVEVAVIPGNVRPILGMSILSRLAPFTFSAEPAQIGLQRCQAGEPETEAASLDDGQAEAAPRK